MHSEHLQNVRIGRVAGGWLVAIAVTSLVMLVLTSLGFADGDGASAWWSLLPVAVGFFVGGMFCGMRALQAPVLHGISMGLMSLVVWLIVSILAQALKPDAHIASSLTPSLTVAVMFVQIAAAIVGALIGYNIALRGKPGLSE